MSPLAQLVPDRPPADQDLESTRHSYRRGRPMSRRIVMNPPESFIAAVAAENNPAPVNNPIVFGDGGQAVMVSPTSPAGQSNANSQDPAGGGGGIIQMPVPVQPAQSAPAAPNAQLPAPSGPLTGDILPSATAVIVPQSTALPTPSQVQPTATEIVVISNSVIQLFTTTQVTNISSASAVTPTIGMSTQSPSQAVFRTTPIATSSGSMLSASTTSAPASQSASQSGSSASPSATNSAAAAATAARPFVQTTPFIFLMVLLALVVVALAATACSNLLRWRTTPWSCYPCCKPGNDPDEDDDGLSEFVRSLDQERSVTTSRASSLRRMTQVRPSTMDLQQADLQRRSSLFATEPASTGLLHTKALADTAAAGSVFDDPGGVTNHLQGLTGPLQVRNAVDGDIEDETTIRPASGPRWRGVDGFGLDVPWRPSYPQAALGGVHSTPQHMAVNQLSLSAPYQGEYPDESLPSPLETEGEMDHPTRASTWASNLRNSLFAAIAGPKPSLQQDSWGGEDKFTRQILPLHGGSTVQSTRSLTDEQVHTFPRRSFPMIIDEKDELEYDDQHQNQDHTLRAMDQDLDLSRASSIRTTLNPFDPSMLIRAQSGADMGERYKTWSRSQRSESRGSWATEETVWDGLKPVLAGGQRAKGVRASWV